MESRTIQIPPIVEPGDDEVVLVALRKKHGRMEFSATKCSIGLFELTETDKAGEVLLANLRHAFRLLPSPETRPPGRLE